MGSKAIKGFYVVNVIPDSGAEEAGIKNWDIIIEVDGKDKF